MFGLRQPVVGGGEGALDGLSQALKRFRSCAAASKLLNSEGKEVAFNQVLSRCHDQLEGL